MALKNEDFLLDIWALDKNGRKLYPYKGEQGTKKGLYSVNLSNDTNEYHGMTETQLINSIEEGKFKERGTIRMLALDYKSGCDRNGFSPTFYRGKHVKDLV